MQKGINTKAIIDLSALVHNYKLIRETVSPSRVMCVVKADAYGHGAPAIVKRLREEGADFFAVANFNEASEIKESACGADILILGPSDVSIIPEIIENGFIQTIPSYDFANKAAELIEKGKKLRCHLSVDTGMNRIGFRRGEEKEMEEIISSDIFDVEGIFSHFVMSDEPNSDFSKKQLDCFLETVNIIKKDGFDPGIVHIANSAALLTYPSSRLDMVRAGIDLYGLNPSDKVCATGFRPVMSFISKITHIHTIEPGETVSYGGLFKAERRTVVATVAAGYADGFSRRYGGGEVLISGRGYAGIIGNICMDQFMCDITDLDGVSVGDEVILFGAENRADALARLSGSINYEAVCAVSKRVTREYIEEKPEDNITDITLEDIAYLKYDTPSNLGICTDGIEKLLKIGKEESIHSIIVMRHGKIAVEAYYYPYDADTPHLLNSVSKSFTSVAMMFARKEGLLDYDDKVCSFFPDIEPDESNKNVTLRNLLMMCWGHSNDNDFCLSEPDPVKACLQSPIDIEPGTHFIYETTASYLLSAVITAVTGQNMEDYLTPRLFKPLGITSHSWQTDPQGRSCGGYGLSLTTRDMARFGQFMLHHGMGLIDEEYIKEASSLQIIGTGTAQPVPPELKGGYGYQFWVAPEYGVYRADGAFGQFVIMKPDLDLVIAVTAGNPDNGRILLPLTECIFPAVRDDCNNTAQDEAKLAKACKSAVISMPSGKEHSNDEKNHSGNYKVGENELDTAFIDLSFFNYNDIGIEEYDFNFENKTITLRTSGDDIILNYGFDSWVVNTVKYKGKEYKIGACGSWQDDAVFNLRLVYTQYSYIDDVLIGFDGSDVTIEGTRNATFRPENYRVNGSRISL